MNKIIGTIIKLFFIDFSIFIGIILFSFFVFVFIKAIQNGKSHYITDDNIISYCLRIFPSIIGKYIRNMLKWWVILFLIHICFSLFNVFTEYVKSAASPENAPLLAFIADTVNLLIPIISPFILPVVIIIFVYIFSYGLFSTFYQLSKNEMDYSRMFHFAESIKDETLKENNPDYENNVKTKDIVKRKNNIHYKPSKKEILFFFGENVQKGFFNIARFLPKIFIIILVCIGINGIFINVQNLTKIYKNQKRIQELNITIKNLSNSEGLARITLLSEESLGNSQYPMKKYKIEILSQDGEVIPSQTQYVSLRGNEIFIDIMNVNFEYSEIAQGGKYNIAYPYRVYSETMSPDKAVPLTCMYEDGKSYPVIYSLNSSQIYGIKDNVFYTRLAEIFDILKNEIKSREMGIRSIIGVAGHFVMKPQEARDIFIEGTGGVSIKKHKSLFDETKTGF